MFVQSKPVADIEVWAGGKLSWKRPSGLCRWPTSQHSEKNELEKQWRIRVWMAIIKAQNNGKSPKNA